MKKIVALLLTSAILITFAACGEVASAGAGSGPENEPDVSETNAETGTEVTERFDSMYLTETGDLVKLAQPKEYYEALPGAQPDPQDDSYIYWEKPANALVFKNGIPFAFVLTTDVFTFAGSTTIGSSVEQLTSAWGENYDLGNYSDYNGYASGSVYSYYFDADGELCENTSDSNVCNRIDFCIKDGSVAQIGLLLLIGQDTASQENNSAGTSNIDSPDVEETPEQKELEPIVYTGTGDSVLQIDSISAGYVFHISGNQEGRHFAVTAYDASGEYLALLVNTTNVYDGTTIDGTLTASTLEIKASGNWTVELVPLANLPSIATGETMTGNGDSIIKITDCGTSATITGNNDAHHFAVKAYGTSGYDLLVNTTDAYSGTVMTKNSPVFFEVIATGDWSITLN